MEITPAAIKVKPKVAFVGTGWIGINRMKAATGSGLCDPVALADPVPENIEKALQLAPEAKVFSSLEEVIKSRPDGIVIATPSAMHARQCIQALENGIPVFCQKPLARTVAEARSVVAAAQKADRLLGVDLSYRFTEGMQKISEIVHQGVLGEVYAVDLVFHNAYGPDKRWYYEPLQSGGGCLIDLGIHLVDLALWVLDFPEITDTASSLLSGGRVFSDPAKETEDYVAAQFSTSGGTSVRLACSWNLSAGKDAEIKAFFYGIKAAAGFYNLNGSFYDFEAVLCSGTSAKLISSPPDDWGGRALKDWIIKLAQSRSFNADITEYLHVAGVIDRIYGR